MKRIVLSSILLISSLLLPGAVIADSLLHLTWNVAALPAPIGEWSGWIISALFLADSGERITRTIMRKRG